MSSDIRKATGDASWFVNSRLGLFIHWGLYALPARHEWVKNQERITDEDYQKYFDHFDPDLYDPIAWAQAAKAAGMKYFVVTTKHHEGFCLWDTQQTAYKVTNTPYGKELLKPMVEAFRAEGLRVGFYYSLIDWHHPDFPVDRFHPMRDSQKHRAENKNKDMRNYAAYMQAQLRELMTDFGQIDHLFLDFSYPGEDGKGHNEWQSEALVKMIRELQPNILINDRADLMETDWGWDFKTPEQFMVRDWVKVGGQRVLWETCQTFSGSWGYHRDESTWKSVEQLVQMLIETVSKGGNLLLNVGPTARGEFDERAMERLSGLGKWLKNHGRSIYGCTEAPAEFTVPPNCQLTFNPETNRLYIHLFTWPLRELHLDGFASKVKYAQLLHDASEVRTAQREAYQAAVDSVSTNTLTLELPVQKPSVAVPVIELFLA